MDKNKNILLKSYGFIDACWASYLLCICVEDISFPVLTVFFKLFTQKWN